MNRTREDSVHFEVESPLRLTLTSANGAVNLQGTPGRTSAEVHVKVTEDFGSAEDVERVLQQALELVRYEGGELRIEAPLTPQSGWLRNPRIEYSIQVPAATSAQLRSLNGCVEVGSIDGPLEVHSQNGQARLRDVSGHVRFDAGNGELTVERLRGGMDVSVGNGRVSLQDATGKVALRGANGIVSYRGAVWDDIDVEITNGNIDLDLPDDARFRLDAETVRGVVESDFEVRDGATAGPAPSVKLRAKNGNIRLRRLQLV